MVQKGPQKVENKDSPRTAVEVVIVTALLAVVGAVGRAGLAVRVLKRGIKPKSKETRIGHTSMNIWGNKYGTEHGAC